MPEKNNIPIFRNLDAATCIFFVPCLVMGVMSRISDIPVSSFL